MNERSPRTGAGRPEFEPTDDQRKVVKAMAAYGIPQFDIARVIGCSAPTLRLHFALELETGSTEATAQIAQTLFNIATGGGKDAAGACMFWLRCRAGWRDRDGPAAEPPGKKEERLERALNAGVGTKWGDLLSPPTSSLN
jgi:hypothetical protein